MAQILHDLNYISGDVLDTAGHSKNIFNKAPGRGILSEPNGGLDSTNLAAGFKVSAEHLATESVHRARMDGARDKVACVQDAFTRSDTNYAVANAPKELWAPIPGCGLRWYQHFASSVTLIQAQFFFNPWHVNYYTVNPQLNASATPTRPDVAVALKLETPSTTSLVLHTKRPLPVGALYDHARPAPGAGPTTGGSPARVSFSFDLAHMITSAASGWYSVQLCMYLESTIISRNVSLLRNGQIAADYDHRVRQRASFGVRNVRVLPLL